MKWNQEFSVGIREIDDQHRILADCVTSVEQAVFGRERWIAVHSALIRVAEFARLHFAVEECLMRIHAFPDLDAHAATHREFTAHIEELQRKSLTVDVSAEMIAYTQGWLEMHVPMLDRRYADYFRERVALPLPAGSEAQARK